MTLQTHEQTEHIRSLLSPQDVDSLFETAKVKSWADLAFQLGNAKEGKAIWEKVEEWCADHGVKLIDYGTK